MVEALQRITEIEKDNERVKNELALLHDFDPVDAFKSLLSRDLQEDGVFSSDIIRAFDDHHNFTTNEIDIFLRRHESKKLERRMLTYNDFAHLLMPQEGVFADYFHRKGMSSGRFVMSTDTRTKFLEALQTMISNEVKI